MKRKFSKDSGAVMVEYAVGLAALMAMIILVYTTLGKASVTRATGAMRGGGADIPCTVEIWKLQNPGESTVPAQLVCW